LKDAEAVQDIQLQSYILLHNTYYGNKMSIISLLKITSSHLFLLCTKIITDVIQDSKIR